MLRINSYPVIKWNSHDPASPDGRIFIALNINNKTSADVSYEESRLHDWTLSHMAKNKFIHRGSVKEIFTTDFVWICEMGQLASLCFFWVVSVKCRSTTYIHTLRILWLCFYFSKLLISSYRTLVYMPTHILFDWINCILIPFK